MTIHRLPHAFLDHGLDHVRAKVEHPDQLSPLQTIEITQHMVFGATATWPPDAHSAACEVRAPAVLHHGAQPVVSGRTAA